MAKTVLHPRSPPQPRLARVNEPCFVKGISAPRALDSDAAGAQIVAAPDTGTLFLRNEKGPALRALRTARTEAIASEGRNSMAELGAGVREVYFGGDLEAGVALTGQVAGRIEAVEPVAEILARTVREFGETIERLQAEIAHSPA